MKRDKKEDCTKVNAFILYALILLTIITFNNSLLYANTNQIEFQPIKQGLPHQLVRSIFRDYKGFIWFGTQEGLARFDGYDFRIYNHAPNDSTSLCHSTINVITEDGNKNMWIGTVDGLSLYNREKDNFINYTGYIKSSHILGNISISSIYDDKKGNIWIGTIGNGIIKLNLKTLTSTFYYNNPEDKNSLNSNYITSITPFEKGVFTGSYEGIILFDTISNKYTNIKKNPDDINSLSNNNIISVYTKDGKEFWIGTQNGLNRININGSSIKVERIPLKDKNGQANDKMIICLTGDGNNNIWIGTDNDGLYSYNSKNSTTNYYSYEEGNPNSILSNTINSILFDYEGILWLGASHRGACYYNNSTKRFEHFKRNIYDKNTLSDNDVRGFVPDREGNIWLATDGGGICKFDPINRKYLKTINIEEINKLSNNAVTCMAIDYENNIWVGSWMGGIDKFSKDERFLKNYKIEGIPDVGNNKIVSLLIDKKGRLWAGTSGSGIYLYDKTKDIFSQIKFNNEDVDINTPLFVIKIFSDSDNTIWVTTIYGLLKITETNEGDFNVTRYYSSDKPGSISSNRISSIYEDQNHNIWVGTEDMGINLYSKKDNSFISFQVKDGLPGNSIKGIIDDKSGNLWISTYKSLSIFNYKEKSFTNFDENEGMTGIGFYNNSNFRSSTGVMYFGGSNGFILFNPEKEKGKNIINPVYLTDLKIFNKSVEVGAKDSPLKKSIDETEKIILNHKQTSFSIDFVSINFTTTNDQYSYILEGLEDDWNYIGTNKTASYTYIRPGKYTFKVRNSNSEGVWNSNIKTLEITILPPWWKTLWAYMAYALIVMFLMTFILRLLIIKTKQSRDLELDRLKMQFFTNISHELRTPLSLIIAPLENILTNSKLSGQIKNQLMTINKNANNLYQLVNELMDFSKADEKKLSLRVQSGDIIKIIKETTASFNETAELRHIKLKVESDEDKIDIWFDRNKVEKILMNLLSNAFKFTNDNGEIKVEVIKEEVKNEKYPEGCIRINVKDNGIGISEENIKKLFNRFYQVQNLETINNSGTGIGLSMVKMLAEIHKGEISVKSKKDEWTCFTIILPLGKGLFSNEEINNTPTDVIYENKSDDSEAIDNVEATKDNNKSSLLIVEDNSELRDYLFETLSEKYRVLKASNGTEGLEIAVSEVPDLILSDVVMPNITGFELCRKIKKNILTSHIPVILLTAMSTTDDKIEGTETGADAYLTKPFSQKLLEATIKNLIETRHTIFKRFSQEVYILPKEISNNNLDQEFLEKIIKYINENITKEDLSVENLSAYLLMSRGHVWRKVKALTGQSVTEFIRTIRLKKSIKLMEEGQLNISEIAYKVGFASPAYFTKCFREQFGKSPTWFLSKKNKPK